MKRKHAKIEGKPEAKRAEFVSFSTIPPSYGNAAIAYVLDFFLLLARWYTERKEDRLEDSKKKVYNYYDVYPKSLQIKTN